MHSWLKDQIRFSVNILFEVKVLKAYNVARGVTKGVPGGKLPPDPFGRKFRLSAKNEGKICKTIREIWKNEGEVWEKMFLPPQIVRSGYVPERIFCVAQLQDS